MRAFKLLVVCGLLAAPSRGATVDENRENFFQSVYSLQHGVDALAGVPKEASAYEKMRAQKNFANAVKYSQQVEAGFLNRAHPELKTAFELLSEGARLMEFGLRISDMDIEKQGAIKVIAWSDFWDKNKMSVVQGANDVKDSHSTVGAIVWLTLGAVGGAFISWAVRHRRRV